MSRGTLIALAIIPAIAMAGNPKKKGKGGKKAAPEEKKPDDKPAEAAPPATPPPAEPTGLGTTKGTQATPGTLSSGTAGAVPASAPQQPAGAGGGSAAPPPTDKAEEP